MIHYPLIHYNNKTYSIRILSHFYLDDELYALVKSPLGKLLLISDKPIEHQLKHFFHYHTILTTQIEIANRLNYLLNRIRSYGPALNPDTKARIVLTMTSLTD